MHLTRIDPKTLNQYAFCAHIVASLTSPWCFWVQFDFKRDDAVRCVLNPWLAVFTFWPPGVPRYDSAQVDSHSPTKHGIHGLLLHHLVSLNMIRHCSALLKDQTPKLQLDSGQKSYIYDI